MRRPYRSFQRSLAGEGEGRSPTRRPVPRGSPEPSPARVFCAPPRRRPGRSRRGRTGPRWTGRRPPARPWRAPGRGWARWRGPRPAAAAPRPARGRRPGPRRTRRPASASAAPARRRVRPRELVLEPPAYLVGVGVRHPGGDVIVQGRGGRLRAQPLAVDLAVLLRLPAALDRADAGGDLAVDRGLEVRRRLLDGLRGGGGGWLGGLIGHGCSFRRRLWRGRRSPRSTGRIRADAPDRARRPG